MLNIDTNISIPLELEGNLLITKLQGINRLSLKGFIENEKIEKRRQALNAFQQKERKRLENAIKNMEIRDEKTKRAKLSQDLNKLEVKAKKYRIKRTRADDAFSLCVRLRANCTCERCGEKFPANNMKHLHCSHNYSREYKQVRYHPDNAFALCKDCHWWFSKNKIEATQWKNDKLGAERLKTTFQSLQSDHLKNISKTEEEQITAYYSMTARFLTKERESGNTEYIPFKMYYSLNRVEADTI